MEKFKVHVSVPGSYEGLELWVEAQNQEDAIAQVELLLQAVRSEPGVTPEVAAR